MNATLFIAASRDGIVRAARHSGDDWSVETGLAGVDVRCLTGDPLNPDVIYAGTQGGGMLRSNDRGESWRPAGVPGQIVKAIGASRLKPNTVYAGTKPALLFVSENGGADWSEVQAFRKIPSRRFWFSPAEPPFIAYVQGIALSPTNPETILVGIEFGAVVRRTDGGKSWSGHRRGALRDCHTITFHQTNGDYVYEAGGTGGGAAVSRDAGSTWTNASDGLDRNYGWACAPDPEDPETWYVSVAPGPSKAHSADNAQACLFRSTNGGPWEKLTGGLPEPLKHMPYVLFTDASAPGHVYAGLSNGDVWFSADYGEGWRQLPFSLGAVRHTAIML